MEKLADITLNKCSNWYYQQMDKLTSVPHDMIHRGHDIYVYFCKIHFKSNYEKKF